MVEMYSCEVKNGKLVKPDRPIMNILGDGSCEDKQAVSCKQNIDEDDFYMTSYNTIDCSGPPLRDPMKMKLTCGEQASHFGAKCKAMPKKVDVIEVKMCSNDMTSGRLYVDTVLGDEMETCKDGNPIKKRLTKVRVAKGAHSGEVVDVLGVEIPMDKQSRCNAPNCKDDGSVNSEICKCADKICGTGMVCTKTTNSRSGTTRGTTRGTCAYPKCSEKDYEYCECGTGKKQLCTKGGYCDSQGYCRYDMCENEEKASKTCICKAARNGGSSVMCTLNEICYRMYNGKDSKCVVGKKDSKFQGVFHEKFDFLKDVPVLKDRTKFQVIMIAVGGLVTSIAVLFALIRCYCTLKKSDVPGSGSSVETKNPIGMTA
eukprot:g3632.t1